VPGTVAHNVSPVKKSESSRKELSDFFLYLNAIEFTKNKSS
jgi:hypothetical protein